MADDRSHYATLGCEPSASPVELRRAYLRQARLHHPDFFLGSSARRRGDAELRMREINEAWTVLGDPSSRAAYDAGEANGARHRVFHDEWVPYDPTDGPDPRDLLDDTPMHGSRGLPDWLTMLPVVLLVCCVLLLGAGVLLKLGAVLAAAAVTGGLAVVSFFVVPLVALSRSQRDPGMASPRRR